MERVTLREAADLSGLSYSTLQTLVAKGKIENVAEKGSPQLRRMDVPWRPYGTGIDTPVETVSADPGSSPDLLRDELLEVERHAFQLPVELFGTDPFDV